MVLLSHFQWIAPIHHSGGHSFLLPWHVEVDIANFTLYVLKIMVCNVTCLSTCLILVCHLFASHFILLVFALKLLLSLLSRVTTQSNFELTA